LNNQLNGRKAYRTLSWKLGIFI